MTRERRSALIAAAAALVVIAGILAVSSRSGGPPPDRAAGLVPADAFLYLHLAAGEDDQQERAGELVDRVQGLGRLRDGLLELASASGGNFDFESDVRPWLGDEAAAALVGPAPDDARSLLVLEAADEEGAGAFMRDVAGSERTSYRGTDILGSADVASAQVDGFVLVGPLELLRQALDVRAGAGPALAGNSAYLGLRDGLPAARLVYAYASRPGLGALLAGRAAPLAELPGVADLEAGALGFSVSEERAQLSFRGLSPAGAPGTGGCPSGPSDPAAAAGAPAGSLAYVETPDAACILRGLVASPDSALGAAVRKLGADIRSESDVDLAGDLLPLLDGLTTMTLTRAGEDPPVATLVARGNSGDTALPVLNRLQPALVRLAQTAAVAPPPGPGGGVPDQAPDSTEAGQAPGFEVQDVGGVAAVTAALAPGIQLSYASIEDSLVVSTALDGIGQTATAPEGGLAASEDFKALLEDRPQRSSATVFLDLDKLLALGDQIGLMEAPGYTTARGDLQAIGAAATVFSREGNQTRAELLFKSP